MVKGEYTHIKRVHMEGFRSYKDQMDDEMQDFSKGVNVIVGKNGSGKSNFFLAIKFVLSDAYSNVRAEERRRLIHEGGASEDITMSARVEIVFDNSDGRFPVDKDEIVLRRVIGLKKDEYYLDNHQIKKADVNNLLESAGFSRANPYYIVQQGKVAALTNMKDAERLELLKEVAGTRVYDERKTESLKIMAETEDKVEKVNEMLDYISQRLEELEQEKEELKAYQTLDTKKRALEYAMYDQELHDAQTKLTEYDEERANIVNDQQAYSDSMETYGKIRMAEKELKNITAALQAYQDEKDILEKEKHILLQERAKMDIEVNESKDKLTREDSRVRELSAQLRAIEDGIADRTNKLENAKQKYQSAITEETEVSQRIAGHERRLTDLYAKQGQSKVYKTAQDRDKALNKEVKELESEIKSHDEMVKTISKQVAQTKENLAKNIKARNDTKVKVDSLLKEIEKAQNELLATKTARDTAANNRKDLWKKENDVVTQYNSLLDQLNKGKQQMASSMPKALSAGYAHVRNIVLQNPTRFPKDKKVFGPLIDLFTVEEGYETSVEVIAGNSLFYYVVDTDETAAELLELLQSQKACRISFIPLNRITHGQAPNVSYPGVQPMMDFIKCSIPACKKALLHVFGKTFVANNLQTASDFTKQHDLNCVTQDGDQVSRKGAMTGGFHDPRTSRIATHKAILQWTRESNEKQHERDSIKDKLQQIEGVVNTKLSEMKSIEENVLKMRSTYEHSNHELQNIIKDIEMQQEFLESKERALAETQTLLHRHRETTDARRAELGTPLQSQLSPAEVTELHNKTEELATLKQEAVTRAQARAEAERTRNNLTQELTENFNKRRAEVSTELANVKVSDEGLTLKQREADLKIFTDALGSANRKLNELEASLKTKRTEQEGKKTEIEKLKDAEKNANKRLEEQTKAMEKLLNKRSVVLQKKEECTRKIRELGSLPTGKLGDFKNMKLSQLIAELKEVNTELKGYSSVNKKALDQYMSFSEQKVELTARKTELDNGQAAIKSLIDNLDARKDEAIERTFRGVAKNFKTIFEELIPNGSASLRISRDADEDPSSQSSQSSQPQSRVMKYKGISIKCSFEGKEEKQVLNQLSGGQKTLVALALIFAIQRADPAPFYLFDEVDAALDDVYRHAVAQMIARQAENTQFIISTFHPQFVEVASNIYEVQLKHDSSRLVSSNKKAALKLLTAEEKQRKKEEQQQKEKHDKQKAQKEQTDTEAQEDEEMEGED